MLIGPSIFNVPDMALIAPTACWKPSGSNETHLRKSNHNPCPRFNYSMAKKNKIKEKKRTKETLRQINLISPFVINLLLGYAFIYYIYRKAE